MLGGASEENSLAPALQDQRVDSEMEKNHCKSELTLYWDGLGRKSALWQRQIERPWEGGKEVTEFGGAGPRWSSDPSMSQIVLKEFNLYVRSSQDLNSSGVIDENRVSSRYSCRRKHRSIESYSQGILLCRNEMGALGTLRMRRTTALKWIGIMVADDFSFGLGSVSVPVSIGLEAMLRREAETTMEVDGYHFVGLKYKGRVLGSWKSDEPEELNGMIVKREVLMVVRKQPFLEKKSDNFSSRKNWIKVKNVDETEVSSGILPEKAQEHIEFSRNITSCRNEVGTLGTKDEEVTAEMDKGIMVADSFRSEQECWCRLALVWKYAMKAKETTMK
ncbi:hypothetical protein TNCV_4801631 [Trichonephila clavipes]|nr:hypothetical protein TNCV_4801631 [Trichonephila clavipes]